SASDRSRRRKEALICFDSHRTGRMTPDSPCPWLFVALRLSAPPYVDGYGSKARPYGREGGPLFLPPFTASQNKLEIISRPWKIVACATTWSCSIQTAPWPT